jgi:hypothetical protein
MPLLGHAAVAMWWTVDDAQRSEFGDWHSHEHFPERMGIPGFRRGSRWTGAEGRFFVLYELESYATLSSADYRRRLDAPTPWSTKMMPHHLGMVRSQCEVRASHGGGIGGALATLRLSPREGAAQDLERALRERLAPLPTRPGLTAAHLLVTRNPEAASLTTEQRIRGADKTADWIVVVSGYDADAVSGVLETDLDPAALRGAGAADPVAADAFRLAYALAADEVRASVASA